MRFRVLAVAVLAVAACLSAGQASAGQASAAQASAAQADEPEVPDGKATVDIVARPLAPQNAPADQYFGRLKLSNLGMRNIIHAIAVEGDSPLALPTERTRIMGVETAIAQWSDEYPRDTWLRNVLFSFAYVMQGKHDVDTDRIAVDELLAASLRYAGTPWSARALKQLAGIDPASPYDWNTIPFDPVDPISLMRFRGHR